ncbi:MAG: hypothetical protein WEB58_14330 [Planctomycetaceae bacterium]
MNAKSGFFTLGVAPDAYRLPHDKFGLPVILLIRRVLCKAFEQLREQRFRLADAEEDQITQALLSVIENNLRQHGTVPGFDRRSFEPVVRQTQAANYDGTHIAKTPDLCFRLRRGDFESRMALSEYDALFVECKPVDAKHFAGADYCEKGLIRFVRGDYSWAMQEGMMLAYARDGRTIADHLIPAMNEKRNELLGILQLPTVCTARGAEAVLAAEAVFASKHRRDFEWPDGKGAACEITIFHLWHDCT